MEAIKLDPEGQPFVAQTTPEINVSLWSYLFICSHLSVLIAFTERKMKVIILLKTFSGKKTKGLKAFWSIIEHI